MSTDATFPLMSSALAKRSSAPAAADDVRAQRLWLALQQRAWRSLAVLAASDGVDTLEAANSLARIGWWYTGQPACVFDMRDLSLRLLEHQIRDMAAQLQGGERVFVALRSLDENPTAAPLAMAADAVILCVQLGRTDARIAKKAISSIGKQRFLGTLLVEQPKPNTELMVDPSRLDGEGGGFGAPL